MRLFRRPQIKTRRVWWVSNSPIRSHSVFAKPASILFVLVLAILLVCGFVANNLWRWLPEFHTLDAISAFPIYLQIIFLLLGFIALGAILAGRRHFWWLCVPVVVVSGLSWYSVRVSDSENALIYGIEPMFSAKVRFSEIESVEFGDASLRLLPVNQSVPLPPSISGFDSAAVSKSLRSSGQCLDEMESPCKVIQFASP